MTLVAWGLRITLDVSLLLYNMCTYILLYFLIPSYQVKCTLVQALRLCTGRTARRGSRNIALPFLDHSIRRGEGSASRLGRSLPLGKTRYPLYSRLVGPQGRSGQVRKISPSPWFDPRTVQPVVNRYTDYATRPTYLLTTILKIYWNFLLFLLHHHCIYYHPYYYHYCHFQRHLQA